jgi:hypothetical protein
MDLFKKFTCSFISAALLVASCEAMDPRAYHPDEDSIGAIFQCRNLNGKLSYRVLL